MIQDAGLEKELISLFKEVLMLASEDKKAAISLMDGYIAKSNIQTLLHDK